MTDHPTLRILGSQPAQTVLTVDSTERLADLLLELMAGRDATVVVEGDDHFAGFVHDQASRIADVRDEVPLHLSIEAEDLLRLLASGLTTAQAARLINLSTRTAFRLLAEARAALGARTTAEAVLMAERPTSGPRSDSSTAVTRRQ